jgi:hypothetical protein
MADVTPGVGFVGIQPCRVADTRGNGAPIQGGIFPNSGLRTWDLTGLCGLPAGTDAISANFTVVAAGGIPPGSFLLAWPTGQPPPPTAIMTYGPGQIISNAAIVPLGPGEQLNVNVSGSTHVVMDVNGYFTDQYNNSIYGAFHAVSINGSAAITAENVSGVGSAYAIEARINHVYSSPDAEAAAIIGRMNGLDTYGFGVSGQNNGAGSGVRGSSRDGYGVFGSASGGIVVNSQTTILPSAGVRGESGTATGVLGIVQNAFGDGVRGVLLDDGGTGISAGSLGHSATAGVFFVGGLAGFGTKNFLEPHPTDPTKEIRYVSLEGNEAGTYFRGRGRFQNGIAMISVPEDFRMVTDPEGLSIQVTPIGQMATVAVETIGLDRIVIRGSRNVEFFYLVNGERRAYKNVPVIVESEKPLIPESAAARIPLWLSEDERQRLITNGTYRPDGTVNMETARRLGWDKEWEKRARPAPQTDPD